VQVQATQYAGQDGQRRKGATVDPREIELPLLVYGDSSDEWLGRDQAFWGSFSFLNAGTLKATTPAGSSRTLKCFLSADGGQSFDSDPIRGGWSLYTLTLLADDPYWVSELPAKSWGTEDPLPFFPATGWPPLQINSASSLSGATLNNPGDVDAWPIWTITAGSAPVTATITVDGGVLVTPAIAAGRTLTINTDPWVQTATLSTGADVYAQMKWDPRPIPAGNSVPVSLVLDQTGTVTCQIFPKHFRAW